MSIKGKSLMAKILLIGDPHIRHTHLKEGEDLLRWVEEVIEEHKPDLVVNLGDTLDDHAVIRAEVLCTVSKHIDRVAAMKVPMIMLLGNHDMWKPSSSQYHALEVLKGKPLLTVADSIITQDNITYIPYLPDPKDWPEVSTDIAITHNTFKGADYGFKLATDGISIDQVSCDLVASGHIHKQQQIYSGSVRLLYPGTPMCLSASDADQVKGLTILDSDTLETSFITSPFPMWRTLDFYVGQDSDLNINLTDRWVVKLIGPRAEIKAMLESDQIKDIKRKVQITFKTEFTDTLKSSKVSIAAPTVAMMTDQYIDKIYSGSLNKDELKSIIKPYMEK